MILKNTHHLGHTKGESLVEVIMAIFVVALGSGVATSLIVSALQANSFSRDNLIALNLAVEGIEAVREIRDANWLRFSYNKDQCWNMRPDSDDCVTGTRIAAGNYTVNLNIASYKWNIPDPALTGNLDLDHSDDTANDQYRLFYNDVSHTMYITPGAPGLESPFYRMVTIGYPATGDPATDPTISVSALVQWKSQGVTHQVTLQTELTNYQKVKRTT